jgi:hypothetical protein
VVCVLVAMTAVAGHTHLSGKGADTGHCDLCMLSAGLLAVIAIFLLSLSLRRATRTHSRSREQFSLIRFGAHSIRPPPAVTFTY